jgi:hypothetical protein
MGPLILAYASIAIGNTATTILYIYVYGPVAGYKFMGQHCDAEEGIAWDAGPNTVTV